MFFERFSWPKVKAFLKHYLGGIYERMGTENVLLHASGLSFSLFICLLPLVLIVFSILGILLSIHGIPHQIDNFIDTLIPYEKSSAVIKELIFERLQDFSIFRTWSGSIGIFGLIFAASGVFGSMRTILNEAYRVQKQKHLVIEKLRDVGMVFLVVFFFLMSFLILPVADILVNIFSKLELIVIFHIGSLLSRLVPLLLSLFSFLLIAGLFFLIYYLIPYSKPPKRAVALSALWAGFLWMLAKEVFGYYVANSLTLSRIYGTYIFVVMVVLWIYYSSIIFIISAIIGQLYRERMEKSQKMKGHLVE